MPQVLLPDATPFAFWDDRTHYRHIYHVAQNHPQASDGNDGTAERPFATIGRAAELLQPGEKVIVHAGIYRETVRPARGGTGPEAMICYEAAAGEEVIIRGSVPWKPAFSAGADWQVPAPVQAAAVFAAELPEAWPESYNPFQAGNMPFMVWFPWHKRPSEEIRRTRLPRGGIYQDGRPLKQVVDMGDLARQDGAFFVAADGTRVFLRLHGDADPRQASLELTVRKQNLAPRTAGLGYIRVRGFICEHAANPMPMTQRGAISATAGHHWIIEHNTVRHANATAVDIGWQGDAQPKALVATAGGHIVRKNHLHDCGTSGITGTANTQNCLIEENTIERIGGLNLEHSYEAAAIKLHFARNTLIRRNVIRHIADACGIWMDWQCANNRLTGNVIADVQTLLAGIYIEANLEAHVVDGNVIWDTRDVPGNVPPKDDFPGGLGISSDVCDFTIAAHNFVGRAQGNYAIAMHLCQKGRLVGARVAMCRDVKVLGNMVVESPKRVMFSRIERAACEGNVYDDKPAAAPYEVEEAGRTARYDLYAWQNYFGFDQSGGQAAIRATVDADALTMTVQITGGPAAEGTMLPLLGDAYGGPGPFDAATWQRLRAGEEVTLQLPL